MGLKIENTVRGSENKTFFGSLLRAIFTSHTIHCVHTHELLRATVIAGILNIIFLGI